MNTNLSRKPLEDTVNFLKKAEKSQPLKLSQATDEKPIFKASEKDGEQLWEEIMYDLNENTYFPKSRTA